MWCGLLFSLSKWKNASGFMFVFKEEQDMNAQEIKEASKKYVLQSWSKQAGLNPIVIDHAEGIYMYDAEGNRYTDMSSQLVNLNVGFGNKVIEEAIKPGMTTAEIDQIDRKSVV